MSKTKNEPSYMKWFHRHPLRPIDTEEDNKKALVALDEMMTSGRLTADEHAYMRVLSTLIHEFESRTYDLGPYLTQGEMLEELMKEHGLTQRDLIPEMGSQSAVSYAVSGKRKLTIEHKNHLCWSLQECNCFDANCHGGRLIEFIAQEQIYFARS